MTSDSANNVALFVTCLADLFRPSVAFSAVKLLEKYGATVSVPAQTCCGQPAYNSGEKHKTRELAQNFIAQFESFDYVVAPSGSCAAMVKIHYPRLFEADSEWHVRSQAVAAKTWELSQYLIDVLGVDVEFLETNQWPEKKFSYHDSCSGLRELGIRSQPRKLLKNSQGIVISEMENSEICCGFGGTFCVKFPEISTRMVDNKIAGLEHTDADIVLGGDLGCLMNMAGRLKRQGKPTQVYHYAEILSGDVVDNGIAEKPKVDN